MQIFNKRRARPVKSDKKLFLLLLALVLAAASCISTPTYARQYLYTMDFYPGTEDEVTNLPESQIDLDSNTAYSVPNIIPERKGYEFLYWTLDYGVASYNVTYVVNPDKEFGMPEDSEVPEDLHEYAWKELVDVADQLTTTQDYANKDGEKIPGTWTFTPWDKDDFEITDDTTITGGWVFTPKTYKVTYVVNPDKTYKMPEGSTVPEDLHEYAWKDNVDVVDQLTTTVDYAYNEKGEKVKGTWKFETWDKDDFEITEDTTVTGGWVFTPAPAKTYKYTIHYKLYEGSITDAKTVHADTPGTVPALGDKVEIDAIPVKDLKPPYKNINKYEIRPGFQHVSVTITHDNFEITIWYQPKSHGS